MDNLARKLDEDGGSRIAGTGAGRPRQELARVVRARGEGDAFAVRASLSEHRARRALSCLVEPEVGDVVLLAVAGEQAWILAILERAPGAKATVVVDGDLAFQVPGGRFTVAAQEGVDLVSGDEVKIAARAFALNAVEGSVVLQSLSFLGRTLRAEVEKIKVVASALDSVLERFSQKSRRSYRTVEELDHVRAEQIDYAAKEAMSLHAKNALVTAEELVKVDGEQIHMG